MQMTINQTRQIQQFNADDRFISVLVYKFPLGNCGGITDHEQYVYIPCKSGPNKFSEINPDLIFIEEQRGPEYYALKPLIQPVGVIGPMAGGNIAYCSDSRVKHVYHIHDRFETQKQYDTLSK